MGFEPMAPCMPCKCATTAPYPQKWRRRDSNPHLLACKASALPVVPLPQTVFLYRFRFLLAHCLGESDGRGIRTHQSRELQSRFHSQRLPPRNRRSINLPSIARSGLKALFIVALTTWYKYSTQRMISSSSLFSITSQNLSSLPSATARRASSADCSLIV